MLRQTHFTFTLAKLRLLQVGLRDLPYRLLTQAASVEPRSSKSAGRTRANRTGSTSSREPRGPPPAAFRFFRPRGAPRRRASTRTPRRQGPPIRSRWATRHVLNLPGPPTRQCQKRVPTLAKVPRWRGRSGACLKTVTPYSRATGSCCSPQDRLHPCGFAHTLDTGAPFAASEGAACRARRRNGKLCD
jgi:hypothetical protein